MARTVITLTDAWQQVATGACIVRVKSIGAASATLSLNESADDSTALNASAVPGDQYAQSESKPTFGKGAGVVLEIDAAG